MIQKIVCSVILIFVLNSCAKEDRSIYPIEIQVSPSPGGKMKLSDICDSVSYLPLEYGTDFLIGGTIGASFSDQFIVLTDLQTREPRVFDAKNGKYIFSLTDRGNGPNEFISSHQLTLGDDFIEINDRNKVLRYSTGGEWKSTHKFPSIAYDASLLADGNRVLFGFFDNEEGELAPLQIIDNQGKKLNTLLPLPFYTESEYVVVSQYFHKTKTEIFFTMPHWDTIYKVNSEEAKPIYAFNFKNKKLTPEDYKKQTASDLVYAGDRVSLQYTLISTTHLWTELDGMKSGKRTSLCYNRQSGEYQYGMLEGNDIDLGVMGYIDGIFENVLYSVVPATDILKRYQSLSAEDKKLAKTQTFVSMARTLSPESNPVIVKYHMKARAE